MKKNILTIIIMAIVLINTILTGVMIFVIVPASNRTTKLVDKIASIVDLELEDPAAETTELSVLDKENYDLQGELQITLKEGSDGSLHYAVMKSVTVTMNTKNADYTELKDKLSGYDNIIKGIISEEAEKYTIDDVRDNMGVIKQAVLTRIQDMFESDFIIDLSFGNVLYQ